MMKSIEIVSYIYKRCKRKKIIVNNTKIQKLLYCCYGAFLSQGKPLFDEHPRAWKYGPVFPKVFKFIYNKGLSELSVINVDLIPKEIKELLNVIVDYFGKYSSMQLVKWSTDVGSPWYSIIVLQKKGYGSFFSQNEIKDYFKYYVFQ